LTKSIKKAILVPIAATALRGKGQSRFGRDPARLMEI
jgi:hypothetical protein